MHFTIWRVKGEQFRYISNGISPYVGDFAFENNVFCYLKMIQ